MATSTSARRGTQSSKKGVTGLLRLYLFAYNVLSFAGWSSILYYLLVHLSSSFSSSPKSSTTPLYEALLDRSHSSYSSTLQLPFNGTEVQLGDLVRWVQTAAVLEVLHVAAGMVRSSLPTTAAQVASRLVLVWGVLVQFPEVRSSPIFSIMVFAWSIAEMVRYSTYALALFGIKIYALEWLRYTLFYILYPLGAGSEAYLMHLSIPYAKARYGKTAGTGLTALLLLWPVALVVLMSHMHGQRMKHIGGAAAGGKGGKTAQGKGKKRY